MAVVGRSCRRHWQHLLTPLDVHRLSDPGQRPSYRMQFTFQREAVAMAIVLVVPMPLGLLRPWIRIKGAGPILGRTPQRISAAGGEHSAEAPREYSMARHRGPSQRHRRASDVV